MAKKIKNLKEYQKLCQKTAMKFKDKEKEILTWGLGLAGEAGDTAGCIKKLFPTKTTKKEASEKTWEILCGMRR